MTPPVVPNTLIIKANNTKARKRSTVTEVNLDVVWIPTGIGSVRLVLVWFLTIPYLKSKQLLVPDLLVNLLKSRRMYSDQIKRLELGDLRSETRLAFRNMVRPPRKADQKIPNFRKVKISKILKFRNFNSLYD